MRQKENWLSTLIHTNLKVRVGRGGQVQGSHECPSRGEGACPVDRMLYFTAILRYKEKLEMFSQTLASSAS